MEEKNEGTGNGVGLIGVLFIFIGIYMFMTGIVRSKAQHLLTIILNSLATLSFEVWGTLALLGNTHLSNALRGIQRSAMLLMWLSLVVYLLTLWEAILEHRTAMRNMAQALQDEESQEESDQAMAEATERMRARQEQYRDKKAQDQANQERLAAEKRIAEAKDTVIKVRFNENNTNWT